MRKSKSDSVTIVAGPFRTSHTCGLSTLKEVMPSLNKNCQGCGSRVEWSFGWTSATTTTVQEPDLNFQRDFLAGLVNKSLTVLHDTLGFEPKKQSDKFLYHFYTPVTLQPLIKLLDDCFLLVDGCDQWDVILMYNNILRPRQCVVVSNNSSLFLFNFHSCSLSGFSIIWLNSFLVSSTFLRSLLNT